MAVKIAVIMAATQGLPASGAVVRIVVKGIIVRSSSLTCGPSLWLLACCLACNRHLIRQRVQTLAIFQLVQNPNGAFSLTFAALNNSWAYTIDDGVDDVKNLEIDIP
jgi:multisubunit Na+/H+ antiporter MnhG subunit